MHVLRNWALAKRDYLVFLRFLSFSNLSWFELEQFGLLHVTLFPVVHLLLTGCFRFGYSRREARTTFSLGAVRVKNAFLQSEEGVRDQ